MHVPNFWGVAGSEDFAFATLPTTPLDFQGKISNFCHPTLLKIRFKITVTPPPPPPSLKTLFDNSDNLKNHLFFTVFPVFFNLNVAKLKNLRLLLNRCECLCGKGFAFVLIKLSCNACSNMLHLLKIVHQFKYYKVILKFLL